MKTLRIDLSKDDPNGKDLLPCNRGRSIALGYFDGVHRGHQELVRQLLYRAELLDLEATIFSFDRYPKPVPPHTHLNATVPGQESPNQYLLESPLPYVDYPFKGLLQSDLQRDQSFERLGVETLILQEFNESFANLSPEDFLQKILLEKLHAKVIIVGEGYRFAKAQSGDVDMLRAFCTANKIELYVVPPLYADGEPVSSTRIRKFVEEGNMHMAMKFLGEPFKIPGKVIHGKALGRTVGMPTANFRIPTGMVVPAYGVYVSRTKIDGCYFDSVTNVGLRPTVNHTDPMPLVETLILDRTLDIYDKDIEVEFLKFTRPEETFPSFIAMSKQIAEDLVEAKEWHKNSNDIYLYSTVKDIPIYLSRSDRFNTSHISLEFFVPLEEMRNAEYALLAQLLTAVSKEYPTRPELQSFLDTQYGAEIRSSIAAINDLQRISFHLTAVHHGLDESTPFKNCLDVFLGMIFSPAKDKNGKWISTILETERMNLLMALRAEENDKASTFYNRATEKIWPEDLHWIHPSGNRESIEAITAESLDQAWFRLISESQIRLFIGGNFDNTNEIDWVANRLQQIPRQKNALRLIPGRLPSVINFRNENKVVERHEIEQAHLIMIFDGMPPYSSTRCLNAGVMNDMLGDSTHSLLFQGIREELGLAYYVESTYDSFAQTITVMVELSPLDVEETYQYVLSQVEHLKAGEYPAHLFELAKKASNNVYLQLVDDRELSLSAMSIDLLAGREFSSDDFTMFQESIREEDIQYIARNMQLKIAYLALPTTADQHPWEVAE